MRDIYLIDFENVASEGLSGITYLSEEDQVIIFYSNNSNRLSMKMHILIGKSVCQLSYFEVSVGGKNALDHQIATWLGYLIGTGAAERNYYIVSRDMGYKHVANFWASSAARPKVRCVENIRAAGRLERKFRERREEQTALSVAEEPQTAQEVSLPLTEPAPTEVLAAEMAAETQLQEQMGEPAEASAEAPAEVRPEPVEAEMTSDVPEAAEAEPMADEPEAAHGEPEAPSVELETLPETQEEPVSETIEALPEPPEDKPEETQPRRSYRGRTKFRRGKTRNRENQPEQAEAKPQESQEVQEPQPAAEPEEPKKQQPRKNQSQRERRSNGAKDEGKVSRNLDQLSGLLAPYPKLQESALRELILANKRQVLCNTLRKQLGQEKGLALYNEIKRTAWH
jgi:hypothetical protein